MTKNPLINALLASGYIIGVVSLMWAGSRFMPEEDNIFMPIGMLSLLVLSVSVMAAIFFLRPVELYLDGERKPAVRLFLTTIAYFSGFVVVAMSVAALVGKL